MNNIYETYQGEDIDFILQGKDDYNLDEIDFTVLVYPCCDPSSSFSIKKSQCTKLSGNNYKATVPASTSKTLQTGPYTIEVFDSTNKKIFQARGRMVLNSSAAKNI